MVKGRKGKCTTKTKKVGNHISVTTKCNVAKMVRGKVSGKRHKKPCKTKKCRENRKLAAEIRKIEAKEYHLG